MGADTRCRRIRAQPRHWHCSGLCLEPFSQHRIPLITPLLLLPGGSSSLPPEPPTFSIGFLTMFLPSVSISLSPKASEGLYLLNTRQDLAKHCTSLRGRQNRTCHIQLDAFQQYFAISLQ